MVDNDPFAALADPTRRQIVEMLVGSGPATATALAGDLAITRQAVAKHLQLLAGAGLASSERIGRETRFQVNPGAFDDVRAWMEQVEQAWTARLGLLAASLGDTAASGNPPPDEPPSPDPAAD